MSQYGGQQQQYGGQNGVQQDPSQSQGQQQYGGQDASQQDPSQSQSGGQDGYGQQDPSQQDPSQQDPTQSQYGGQQDQNGTDGQTDPSQQQVPSQYPNAQQGYNQPMKDPTKQPKGGNNQQMQYSKGSHQQMGTKGQDGSSQKRQYDSNHHNALYVEAQSRDFHYSEVQSEEELTSEKVPHVSNSPWWLHQRPHGILHPSRYLRSRCSL